MADKKIEGDVNSLGVTDKRLTVPDTDTFSAGHDFSIKTIQSRLVIDSCQIAYTTYLEDARLEGNQRYAKTEVNLFSRNIGVTLVSPVQIRQTSSGVGFHLGRQLKKNGFAYPLNGFNLGKRFVALEYDKPLPDRVGYGAQRSDRRYFVLDSDLATYGITRKQFASISRKSVLDYLVDGVRTVNNARDKYALELSAKGQAPRVRDEMKSWKAMMLTLEMSFDFEIPDHVKLKSDPMLQMQWLRAVGQRNEEQALCTINKDDWSPYGWGAEVYIADGLPLAGQHKVKLYLKYDHKESKTKLWRLELAYRVLSPNKELNTYTDVIAAAEQGAAELFHEILQGAIPDIDPLERLLRRDLRKTKDVSKRLMDVLAETGGIIVNYKAAGLSQGNLIELRKSGALKPAPELRKKGQRTTPLRLDPDYQRLIHEYLQKMATVNGGDFKRTAVVHFSNEVIGAKKYRRGRMTLPCSSNRISLEFGRGNEISFLETVNED